MPTSRAPTADNESIISHNPFCSLWPPLLWVCICPLPLHRQLWLALTTKCVHTICSSHYCWLPCSIASRPGGVTEDLSSACIHCRTPTEFAKSQIALEAVDSRKLNWKVTMDPEPTHTHTQCPAPLDLESQHAPVCFLLKGEGLLL